MRRSVSLPSSTMRPRHGINTLDERDDMEDADSLASPTSASNSGFSCNETPSWYNSPVRGKRQRNSLLTRLRTVSTPSRSYSRSPSISSLAETESSSRRRSFEWHQSPNSPPSERQESSAKSMLSRGGRMLRRQGSKFALSSFMLDERSQHRSMEVSETCRRPQHFASRSKPSGSKWTDPSCCCYTSTN
jgi:hypothetical protein